MRWWLSVSLATLLLMVSTPSTQGFPDGAPKNHKVCKTLKPHHHGAHGQESPPPYSVSAAKAKIPVGSSVSITISAQAGHSYKGFILQARPRMRANAKYIRPIGTFKIQDAKNSKTLDCLSAEKNTVTHTNPTEKNSTTFVWTPPAKYKGPVFFRASFVKDFDTFWLNVSSQIVVGDGDAMEAEGLVPVSPDVDTSSTERTSGVKMSPLKQAIYEECALTKACFGIPDNCVAGGNCDALATVAERDSKYEFELMGRKVKYVSVILSENGLVNADSMISCVLVNSSVNLKEASTYYQYQTSGSESNDANNVLINSSYVNGVLYCKFLREETVELNSVHYDLKNNRYFLILAAGDLENEDEIINLDKVQFYVSSRKKYLSDVSSFGASTNINNITDQKYWFQTQYVNWFFGIFDYFMLLR